MDPAEYPARAARQWIPPSIPPVVVVVVVVVIVVVVVVVVLVVVVVVVVVVVAGYVCDAVCALFRRLLAACAQALRFLFVSFAGGLR